MNRRSLITGLIAFVSAPAIVRAGSLMPVKPMDDLPKMLEKIIDPYLLQKIQIRGVSGFLEVGMTIHGPGVGHLMVTRIMPDDCYGVRPL